MWELSGWKLKWHISGYFCECCSCHCLSCGSSQILGQMERSWHWQHTPGARCLSPRFQLVSGGVKVCVRCPRHSPLWYHSRQFEQGKVSAGSRWHRQWCLLFSWVPFSSLIICLEFWTTSVAPRNTPMDGGQNSPFSWGCKAREEICFLLPGA